ncbi:hypothetical protein SARC_07027 [Sphaeroforma arctica JP610]|uniref:Prefoldin subunit 1 n=1 Tax=Sphaeroforma arctica JP610 TaxID=667725 RepID=A0A0L0FXF2_9EUKA|nr:hypothetical protein SARC_07027 [Sphaeroforma arctica JP610]KNC80618.1 hypothetical protein SARC_07027 [Sphaeroforma arctica JP610]|eukprot:XP_014154520.1 hypothetical protein SARC_07027 [Sphaeroforma arctica JP610]
MSDMNELRKVFEETQVQMMQDQQKIRYVESHMEVKQRNIRKTQLTAQELTSMHKDTKCYTAVGRLFINQDTKTITDGLKEQELVHQTERKNLEQQKKYLEKSLKEKEYAMNELLMQRARMQAGQ